MAKKKQTTNNKSSFQIVKESGVFDDGPTIKVIPTGISALDNSMGGGLPVGVISEWYGKEGVGKTSLALKVSKTFLEFDYPVMYIDSEFALTEERLVAHGIDPQSENFVYKQTNDLDDVFQLIDELIVAKAKTGDVDTPVLVIIDSIATVAAYSTDMSELGKAVSKDNNVMLEARILTQALKKRLGFFKKYNVTVLLINQLRQKSSMSFMGPDERSWGANFIKFAAQVRVFLKHYSASFMSKDKYVDRLIKVTYDKNKIGPHYDTVVVFLYKYGYSESWTTFLVLKSNKWITPGGQKWKATWKTDKEEYKSFTKKKFIDMFNNDLTFRHLIYNFLREKGFRIHNYYYDHGIENYSEEALKDISAIDMDMSNASAEGIAFKLDDTTATAEDSSGADK